MEKKSKSYQETLPYRQQLFETLKDKEESLAQWAARLTRLGEESGYDEDYLEKFLAHKFVSFLEEGPIVEYFNTIDNLSSYTFKQVLDMALAKEAELEKESKKQSEVEAKKE